MLHNFGPFGRWTPLNRLKAIRVQRLIEKGDIIMKRISAIALLAIANFALAGTLFAQSNGVQAKIPFDFTVGNKVLPAGTYTIKSESPQVIIIKNHDHPGNSAFSLVNRSSDKSPDGGKLLFQKYGTQYFLSEILCDSAEMNLTVPASKREKRAQLQQAGLNISSTTLVAALTQ
jgi:hypothetical protein